jgi:hypothetical protein
MRLLIKQDVIFVLVIDDTNRSNTHNFARVPLHSRILEAIFGGHSICMLSVWNNLCSLLADLQKIKIEVEKQNMERPESLLWKGRGKKGRGKQGESALRYIEDWNIDVNSDAFKKKIREALRKCVAQIKKGFYGNIAKQMT